MVFLIFQVFVITMSLPMKLIMIAFYLSYRKNFQDFVQCFTLAAVFIINPFLVKTLSHTLLHLLTLCSDRVVKTSVYGSINEMKV